MNDQMYVQIAKAYLDPIKKTSFFIKTAKSELRHIDEDIRNLHALDYSKDKITCGEVKDVGDSIIKMEKVKEEYIRKINALVAKREEARAQLEMLICDTGRAILIGEYINGTCVDEVIEFVGYSRSQGYRHRKQALIELGKQISNKRSK